jgi:hypothetical protein
MDQMRKQAAAIAFLTFLALWVVGIVRTPPAPAGELTPWPASVVQELSSRRQVANNMAEIGLGGKPLPAVLEQADVERIRVFEKTAQLAAGSDAFDDDEAHIRAAIAEQRGTVLDEKQSGLAPRRRLTLELGVHPDRFDALVGQLRAIGHLESIVVQQRDRTGEFRQLHAQRQSLKKHQEAILKLRGGKRPSVEDELRLEQRIREVEKELQLLGVQLGDLLGKESFYHVHLTLAEQSGGWPGSTGLPRRLLRAALWALPWWVATLAALAVLPATWFSVLVLWPGRRRA